MKHCLPGCVLGVHLQIGELQRGEGNFGIVADQTGIRLQEEAAKVHQLGQGRIDGGVGVAGQYPVLGAQHGNGPRGVVTHQRRL